MSGPFDDGEQKAHAQAHLSGRVVGQLAPFEQFLLWALRQRVAADGRIDPVLLRGFTLAFGLAYRERALAAFTDLCDRLEGSGFRALELLPLTCACVSIDEERILALVRCAAVGRGAQLARQVAGEAAPDLLAAAAELAALWGGAAREALLEGDARGGRGQGVRSATARSSRSRSSR